MPSSLRYGPFLLLEPDARERLRANACELTLHEGTSSSGRTDLATLVRGSGRARGEIVEGLAMLVAAGLAEARD